MKQRQGLQKSVCIMAMAALLAGCGPKYQKQENEAKNEPVNCATAEGDIRTLNQEKANVAEQIGMGVSTIAPIGLVGGLIKGTTGTKYRVATGDYNKALDEKIAQIKQTCHIQ